MENLLSLAFDNLSSYDGQKVRKGLRQVEGLLANICLSGQPSKERRPSTAASSAKSPGGASSSGGGGSGGGGGGGEYDDEADPAKTLADLSDDPAFHEFFKLQEGFEWNVTLRLVNTLDRLVARGFDGQNDLLILSALDLIQGTLLLHPPSKTLFCRDMYMNLLLDLLEPDFCPAIQSATLLTLVTALIEAPQNARTFENLDGLLTVTSLFKSRGTSRDVKVKLVEFLYFYLMPETPSIPGAGGAPAILQQRSPSKLAKALATSSSSSPSLHNGAGDADRNGSRPRSSGGGGVTRTQEEKQALLGRHLNSVDELVKDLQHCTPFGGVVC